MHAQEEEEMMVTEQQAYAPITYGDNSSIDFQDKTLLTLTLERESTTHLFSPVCLDRLCTAISVAPV